MGISGLIPFLKDATESIHVKKFANCTLAIDTYCWLHRGAFACAMDLALGHETKVYVNYCMKYINMLLMNDIKPLLVFDGRYLPSKKEVEIYRRERRQNNLKKGKQFLREGEDKQARDCFGTAVNVTPKMAKDVINECRQRGVDYIVAPYEADAQLAYLSLTGHVQGVITEDSDLLAFGCHTVILKMDLNGNGSEISTSRFPLCSKLVGFSPDKFRHMCILSGCDYLPSLPGIGLFKANKVLKLCNTVDITKVVKRLGSYLNMNITISEEYVNGFKQADNTFLYQPVFDPTTMTCRPLIPYSDDVDLTKLHYAGELLDDHTAFQQAIGNIDLSSLEVNDHFDPKLNQVKVNRETAQDMNVVRPGIMTPRHRLSIWSKDYRTKQKRSTEKGVNPPDRTARSTTGKQVIVKLPSFKRAASNGNDENGNVAGTSDNQLLEMYSKPVVKPQPTNTRLVTNRNMVEKPRRNVFAIKNRECTDRLLHTQPLTQSRFFASNSSMDDEDTDGEGLEDKNTSSDIPSKRIKLDDFLTENESKFIKIDCDSTNASPESCDTDHMTTMDESRTKGPDGNSVVESSESPEIIVCDVKNKLSSFQFKHKHAVDCSENLKSTADMRNTSSFTWSQDSSHVNSPVSSTVFSQGQSLPTTPACLNQFKSPVTRSTVISPPPRLAVVSKVSPPAVVSSLTIEIPYVSTLPNKRCKQPGLSKKSKSKKSLPKNENHPTILSMFDKFAYKKNLSDVFIRKTGTPLSPTQPEN